MSEPARMNILLPANVSQILREVIPTRKRARFVAQAVERELRRVQLDAALEISAGAWETSDHPELVDGAAIDRWLAESRQQLEWDRSAQD